MARTNIERNQSSYSNLKGIPLNVRVDVGEAAAEVGADGLAKRLHPYLAEIELGGWVILNLHDTKRSSRPITN